MRKDNPPIPCQALRQAALESLRRFETHWKVQKIQEILSGCSASVQEAGLQRISSEKSSQG